METAIGIDLGTTYSCVAAFLNGRVDVFQNEQGHRITPSCVAFNDVERLIGDAAVNQIAKNPLNSVYDAKRLIGRNFGDECVQSDKNLWPFDVVAGANDKPKIKVTFKNEEKLFSPEEISSMVLSKMKEIAERCLGRKVTNAVVTVPARFNDSQRKATKVAGILAGLNVIRIINEPTAAAFAYGFDRNVGTKNVLIFDAGGGTCDVSILKINDSNFEVKATAGDTHLGGQDLDNKLMNHFIDEIERKHKRNIRNNKRALWRLKSHCEAAKRLLSSAIYADIEIECLDKDFDFSGSITRAKFEDLTRDLLEKFIEPVGSCLADAGMSKNEIDDVVLVGGSTRIPKLQELLAEFFKGKEFCMSKNNVHPDEAVAYGAAVQAAILSGVRNHKIRGTTLQDVTPLTLGKSVVNDVMSVIIRRNTPIPAKNEKLYFTTQDNQTKMDIEIYEGERTRATDNNLLGKFTLSGIPAAPRGVGTMIVRYEVDANSILSVTATEVTTGKSKSRTITNEDERFSRKEIDRMLKDAERYKEEDDRYRKAMEAKNALDLCVYKVKKSIETYRGKSNISATNLRILKEAITQANRCLEGEKRPENEYAEMEETLTKLSECFIN